MSSTLPFIPRTPLAIVSRYEGFPGLMRQLGYADAETVYFPEPHVEDVRGFHLLCDAVDLEVAAHATAVTVVALSLPADVNSLQAPSALLRRYAAAPQTYLVRGSSTLVAAEYNGGTTSAATLAARELIASFGLGGVDAAQLAEKLDQLFWAERRAGEETEKMYLRMLAAERDRRCILETQLHVKPGSSLVNPTIPSRPK